MGLTQALFIFFYFFFLKGGCWEDELHPALQKADKLSVVIVKWFFQSDGD